MGADAPRLQSSLDRLDEVLSTAAPDIFRALRPGLKRREIDDSFAELPFDVPGAVRTLYRWHDGADLVNGPERAELFPNAQMLPLADMIRARSEILEANEATGYGLWDPRWLPLFVGYKWSFWVIDCGEPNGAVKVFDWVDLPVTWTAYRDLDDLAVRVLRCWSEGAYKQGSHGAVDEDRHRSAAINRSLDDSSVDVDQLISDLTIGSGQQYSDALAQLRTRLYLEAVSGLIKLMESGSRGRIAAAELLGWIGGDAALTCLEQIGETETDDHIRQHARHALQDAKLRAIWDSESR